MLHPIQPGKCSPASLTQLAVGGWPWYPSGPRAHSASSRPGRPPCTVVSGQLSKRWKSPEANTQGHRTSPLHVSGKAGRVPAQIQGVGKDRLPLDGTNDIVPQQRRTHNRWEEMWPYFIIYPPPREHWAGQWEETVCSVCRERFQGEPTTPKGLIQSQGTLLCSR